VLTDWGGGIGACPVLRTARTASRYAPVYTYELLDGAPPFGAYHGWDLPFLWDTSIPLSQYPDYMDMTPDQRWLSHAMIDYWTAFARRGDPNTAGRTAWARTHGGTTSVLGLAAHAIAPTPFAADHRCRFWDGIRQGPVSKLVEASR
jgi:para-nitrobenzyl esterase